MSNASPLSSILKELVQLNNRDGINHDEEIDRILEEYKLSKDDSLEWVVDLFSALVDRRVIRYTHFEDRKNLMQEISNLIYGLLKVLSNVECTDEGEYMALDFPNIGAGAIFDWESSRFCVDCFVTYSGNAKSDR